MFNICSVVQHSLKSEVEQKIVPNKLAVNISSNRNANTANISLDKIFDYLHTIIA